MHANCDQCGYPSQLYVHENGDWLCDECTVSADLRLEREVVYGQEGRRRGHSGHNDPRDEIEEIEDEIFHRHMTDRRRLAEWNASVRAAKQAGGVR